MSAEQHEAAAQADMVSADTHDAQYDANAAQLAVGGCPPTQIGREVCWTSVVNPTETHREDARRHRAWAEQHRKASKTLRDVERRACADVPADDRDMSPFRHKEDIVAVTRLERTERRGEEVVALAHLDGATVVLRAVPGLTGQWLQRVIDCHLARNAVIVQESTYMPYCPLALNGVSASVRSLPAGFAVDIRSEDDATAAKVLARAQGLVP